jgi:threonylcarbamoyladenosine tRNA methylthiotransferase MtaB
MKYAVLTFGCRVNQADSLAFEAELQAGGAAPASPRDADLIVVNTCSVTASADQGARQTVRRIARENPSARIVVTGCYATREASAVAALPQVARVVANEDKPRLIQILRAAGLTTAERFADGEGSCGAVLAPGLAGRTAFTLRVQTGCSEPCSYCIIPTTRGAPRSAPLGAVERELGHVLSAGFKEVAITGVHLGSYGRDLAPRASLEQLLHCLAAVARRFDALLRVSSLEPMDCTPAIVRLMASGPFAPHFHLPLQHASGAILKRMRRPYSLSAFAALVADIRRQLPDAAIGSDIIVGFPGESSADHAQLLEYLEGSPLTHLHVFPYSDRPGTVAAGLPGKVPGDIVRARATQIRAVGETLARSFRSSQIGTIHRALTIDDGQSVVTGNYLKVRIPPGWGRNEWVRVRIASEHHGEPLGGGPFLSLDDQLSTGGANVPAAALAHRDGDAAFGENAGEPVDCFI